MTNKPGIFDDIKMLHDELRLQVHLLSMDAQQEWEKLEEKWNDFSEQAGLEESADNLSEALEKVGEELKSSYERIRRAL